jgi:hypothetical protein
MDSGNEIETMDSGYVIETYGNIIKSTIISYWKYQFFVEVFTDKQKIVTIKTGGDRDDIYRYNPLSKDWVEHLAAEMEVIKEEDQ